MSGAQKWFTAAELADLKLPGLPASKRGINLRATAENWCAPEFEGKKWRIRQAAGGGVEYHLRALPGEARDEIIIRASKAVAPLPARKAHDDAMRSERWAWFDRQSDTKKQEAQRRHAILRALEEKADLGWTRSAAVAQMSITHHTAASTIYGWLKLVAKVPRADWLPFLAPRHAGRAEARAEFDEAAWAWVQGDWLRPEEPNLTDCYDRLVKMAAVEGWKIPSLKTVERRLKALPAKLVVRGRKGDDAVAKMQPPQHRDRESVHALEAVNADFHKWDVFTVWPDGWSGRTQLCAFQDIYSGKFLAWRYAKHPNKETVRLTFGDLVETYGIPDKLTIDNGHEFTAKDLTGQVKGRKRFKTRDDDPIGLFPLLGVEVHFARVRHGQAKPIERGFRDFAQRIAKHPAFAGAYTGRNPMAKPANYRERAIPIDLFIQVVDAEIHAHNARLGREGGVCNGRSFDQVFQESYEVSPIRLATAEQRRMWLLASMPVRVHPVHGEIELDGNYYWIEALHELRGQRVVVRFDPAHLQRDLYVYRIDGGYICSAPCTRKSGFYDKDAATEAARKEKALVKATRALADAQGMMTIEEIAARLPETPVPVTPKRGTVVRGLFGTGNTALALPAADTDEQLQSEQRFNSGMRRLRLVTEDGGEP